MLLTLCKSKISPATVTAAHLRHDGNIAIDEDLMEAAQLLPGQQVHVIDTNNGERLITHAVPAARGSGVVCLNGPAAGSSAVGDRVTIFAYAQATEEEARGWQVLEVRVDERNRVLP